LVVLEGESLSIEFNALKPLRGSGIVVVRGDVQILPGSTSYFTGLLYVEGNLTMKAPSQVRGAVVVTGTISVSGVGDYAEVTYDDKIVEGLRKSLANYRISRAARRRVLRE
jgi:formylmethanofuran dehydrogenase subunit C